MCVYYAYFCAGHPLSRFAVTASFLTPFQVRLLHSSLLRGSSPSPSSSSPIERDITLRLVCNLGQQPPRRAHSPNSAHKLRANSFRQCAERGWMRAEWRSVSVVRRRAVAPGSLPPSLQHRIALSHYFNIQNRDSRAKSPQEKRHCPPWRPRRPAWPLAPPHCPFACYRTLDCAAREAISKTFMSGGDRHVYVVIGVSSCLSRDAMVKARIRFTLTCI